ncbi:MAG: ASPIC/UnbV domain-containing protein [Verrucomicrobia bacterium]|nr:ASPIC/UnbV domain-containing protein [Verrucomicrobiota bacterium]
MTVTRKDGGRQLIELHAGGGYLSQSPGLFFFGLGTGGLESVKEISVRLPDGKSIRRALSQLEPSGRVFRVNLP